MSHKIREVRTEFYDNTINLGYIMGTLP